MKTIILYTFLLLSLNGLTQTRDSIIIHFNFDRYDLTTEAKERLDRFIQEEQVLKNATDSISLDGHCDIIGNNAYNDKLSLQRVLAVKDYLLKNNFTESVFSYAVGHGKKEPVNDNATDAERSLNRRVEIVILRRIAAKNEIPKDTLTKVNTIQPKAPLPQKKLSEQIKDTAVKAGSNIVLKNINFVGAMHRFLPESFPVLTELLDIMNANPQLKIEVQGHICCLPGNVDGFDEETRTTNLSEQRAKAVQEYLIKNGIEKRRVAYRGLGHSQPLYSYPEKTELEQTLNRRVEIKIISK